MNSPLKYLSDRALMDLRRSVRDNLPRYRIKGFADLAAEPGWDIPLGLDFDLSKLAKLDIAKPQKISEIDMANSKLVGEALAALNPSLANEERIWVRLAHVEAFDYAQARWLGSPDDDTLVKQVKDHMFAGGQTAIRDDQAISRLWWNYEIAKTCSPDNIDGALELILRSADIRSNFVERIWMTSRRRIAGAVLRAMREDAWVTAAENNFREFMKSLNRFGGGIVFEVMSDEETREFVQKCVDAAKVR